MSGLPRDLQQEAFELENEDLPELQPSVVSQPNLPGSSVIEVRLSQADLDRIDTVAKETGLSRQDLARIALLRYLSGRDTSGEVEDLVAALNASGLRLTRS